MNRPQAQVDVVTEVGYCPSCGRTRNLRREKHHLGGLVRTIVTCETCHRTLSSSIGLATPEPVQPEPEPQPATASAPAPAAPPKANATAKKATAKPADAKPAAKKPAAKKPAKKSMAKSAARGGKPASTATRKVTRKK